MYGSNKTAGNWERALAWNLPVCSLCLRKGFGKAGFVVREAESHKANHLRAEEFGVGRSVLPGRVRL